LPRECVREIVAPTIAVSREVLAATFTVLKELPRGLKGDAPSNGRAGDGDTVTGRDTGTTGSEEDDVDMAAGAVDDSGPFSRGDPSAASVNNVESIAAIRCGDRER
jgi:hypothetical protein